MDNVLKMKLPQTPDEIYHCFVVSDLHSYHLHQPSFDILLQHSKKFKKPYLIINGDLMDFVFLMKKNPSYQKWIKRTDGVDKFFLPEWDKENEVVNNILDMLQKHFVKIVFLAGNHSQPRIEEFIKEIPHDQRPHFDLQKALRLKERAIVYIPYGVWLDVGEISLIHGIYHNVNSHKSHHEICGRSLIFGHIHKAKMVPFKHRGKTHHVWSLPCMSTLNPDYMKKKANDWDLGYGLLHIQWNGKFSFNMFIIEDNQLILPSGTVLYGEENEKNN